MKIKDEAKELASLLGVASPQQPVTETPPAVDESTEELEPEPVFSFNYEKNRRYYKRKAKESIKKIVRVVIRDSELIDKSFIADKIEQDAEQLGQLYYQQRKHEVMQEANMESVRTGNVSPRMFETFAGLGKNLMDINKQIAEFQISIKENYAKIKFDSIDDAPVGLPTADETKALAADGVFRNSKELNASLLEKRKEMMTKLKAAKEAEFE